MVQPGLPLTSPTAVCTTEIGHGIDSRESARVVVSQLVKGGRVLGLTKGQFSMLDLLAELLRLTGPAAVRLSTWTVGIRDCGGAGLLLDSGAMTSFQLYVDRSFATRQPAYCAAVRSTFGDDAIRTTRTHAKLATLRNAKWDITVRSSMNLNRNPRFENFDVDDNGDIADHFDAHFNEMSETMEPGPEHDTAYVDAVFSRLARGLVPFDMVTMDEMATKGAPLYDSPADMRKWVTARLAARRIARKRPATMDALAKHVGVTRSALTNMMRLDPFLWEHVATDVAEALLK